MEWKLIYILPNLRLVESFENEYFAIVDHDDARIRSIIEKERVAYTLITSVRKESGDPHLPCSLLMKNGALEAIANRSAVTAFRNILAISSLVNSCSLRLVNPSNFGPTYSDYFDFYPFSPKKDGTGLIVDSPAVLGVMPRVKALQITTYPYLPIFKQMKADVDDSLKRRLLIQWKKLFIKHCNINYTRTLFRSLEIAYQALLCPYRHSSINEVGANLCLWVSAFEILAHGGRSNVGYKQVIEMLTKRWADNQLDRRRYRIHKKNSFRGCLAQKLYMNLYEARNDFLHGNPLTDEIIYPFGNKRLSPLSTIIPTLYWMALDSYLPQIFCSRTPNSLESAFRIYFEEMPYREALKASIIENDEL